MNRFLFVGPTAYGLELPRRQCLEYRPPVRRGDVHALVASRPPGEIAIVDGTYHSYPAVAHVELRRALEAGWIVWGLSSMGAIRAAEMHTLGMRGFGRIFEAFRQDADMADDEVALLHGEAHPYIPMTEPLVHLRSFIAQLEVDGQIGARTAALVIGRLKTMWFGYRTLRCLKDLLAQEGCLLRNIDIRPHRIKTIDLLSFLEADSWRKPDDVS